MFRIFLEFLFFFKKRSYMSFICLQDRIFSFAPLCVTPLERLVQSLTNSICKMVAFFIQCLEEPRLRSNFPSTPHIPLHVPFSSCLATPSFHSGITLAQYVVPKDLNDVCCVVKSVSKQGE